MPSTRNVCPECQKPNLGAYKCFTAGCTYKVKNNDKPPLDNVDLTDLHTHQAQRARALLAKCRPADPDHPYIARKKIKPLTLLQLGSCLYISRQNEAGEILTFQEITERGEKRNQANGAVKGTFHAIPGDDDRIGIAEGYATGATIHEASGATVYLALSAEALPGVAAMARKRHPDAEITVYGDDDRGNKKNAGRAYAIKAAAEIDGKVCFPEFPEGSHSKETDFNDLYILSGMEAVREKMETSWRPNGGQMEASALLLDKMEAKRRNSPYRESFIAEAIAALSQDRLAWSVKDARWRGYTGTHWEAVPDAVAGKHFLTAIKQLYPYGHSHRQQKGTVELLKYLLAGMQWDDCGTIPFTNGSLDIAEMKLLPHSPARRNTWVIPCDYSPSAECAYFQDWCAQVSRGSYQTVLAFINQAIKGARYEKYLEIVGEGGSGKSTLLRLMTAIIGGTNCHTTSLKSLEENRFETSAIFGKRLVTISDADKFHGDLSMLRRLTGRDPLPYERKFADAEPAFTYHGVVVVAANKHTGDANGIAALARRKVCLAFPHVIQQPDPDIEMRLQAEIPGIINAALRMTDAEVKDVLFSDTAARRAALVESNTLAEWVNECCILDAGGWQCVGTLSNNPDENLYPNYRLWMDETGHKGMLSLNVFTRQLISLFKTLGVDIEKHQSAQTGNRVAIKGLVLRNHQKHAETEKPIFSIRGDFSDLASISSRSKAGGPFLLPSGLHEVSINPNVEQKTNEIGLQEKCATCATNELEEGEL